jgi:hypothetical protein
MPEPDFASEVESGDRKRGLLALRTLLAERLPDAPARDLAALSRRLMQVMEELEALGADDPDDERLSPEDELAAAAMLSCPPRVWSAPPKAGSLGRLAVELAGEAGLELDDWQAWQLEEAMGIRPDGRWSSFEVGLSVARQNGKGSILEARELAGLFLPEIHERLITHTAHEFKTAQEHFIRLATLVEGLPPRYRRLVKHIYEANGSEAIEMRDGRRLRFLARSGRLRPRVLG